jgi:hypothetical protein
MPAGLEKMLLQALSKEPDGRPSLMQVRAVFDSALRTITPTMGVAAGPRPQPERRFTAWIVAGALGALVIACGVYGYRTTRAHETGRALSTPSSSSSAAAAQGRPAAQPARPSTAGAATVAPRAAAEPSRLSVHAPAGAHVAVDGREYVSRGAALLIPVAAGEHRVVVAAPHKLVWSDKVRVAAGASAEVRPSLERTRSNRGTPVAAPHESGPARSPNAKPSQEPKKPAGDYMLDPF